MTIKGSGGKRPERLDCATFAAFNRRKVGERAATVAMRFENHIKQRLMALLRKTLTSQCRMMCRSAAKKEEQRQDGGDDDEMVLQDFNFNEDCSEEDYETAIDNDSDDDSVPEDYEMAVDHEVRFRSQKGPMAIDAIMN
ncbi:hypothetical protein PG989_004765 [Apiospora arundinis]